MTAHTATLRPAVAADAVAVIALLEAAGLPVDLEPTWFPSCVVVAEENGVILGAAGFELADDAGLLRSVAVAPARQRTGLGERLVQDRLAAMAARGCREAYLLTTSAAPYFARLGFEAADRDSAPASLRRLGQFASLCPATATCMKRVVA